MSRTCLPDLCSCVNEELPFGDGVTEVKEPLLWPAATATSDWPCLFPDSCMVVCTFKSTVVIAELIIMPVSLNLTSYVFATSFLLQPHVHVVLSQQLHLKWYVHPLSCVCACAYYIS